MIELYFNPCHCDAARIPCQTQGGLGLLSCLFHLRYINPNFILRSEIIMVSSCSRFLHLPNLHTFNPWKLIKIYIIIIFASLVKSLCVRLDFCACVCLSSKKKKKMEKRMWKANVCKRKKNEVRVLDKAFFMRVGRHHAAAVL